MKWISHEMSALVLTTLLGCPLPTIAGSLVGAVLPDQIDFFRAKTFTPSKSKQQSKWNKVHRGFSHFWGLYVLLLPLLYFLGKVAYEPLVLFLQSFSPDFSQLTGLTIDNFIFGIIIGAFSHILTDMFTPSGVPIWPSMGKSMWKKHRLSLKFFSTGSVQEYIFLGCLTVGFVFYISYFMQDTALYNFLESVLYKIF